MAALRSSTHVHLGFGGFAEYVEEKLRVAEALEELPLIAEAREQWLLLWFCLRELTRVAVAETEQG